MTIPAPESRSAVLARASLRTAGGTVASRLTGLVRLVMIAYALGGSRLADAFNLANNTPNMVHDLVIGGVLGATFVPVFVNRLARASQREAIESISAVVTLSMVVLVLATVVFELLAPLFVDLYLIGVPTGSGHAQAASERALAIDLLRYFVPQLFFYGAISLMGAVLATRDRFGAVGVAPVVNNLVGIAVLATFAALSRSVDVAYVAARPGLVALLGVGTTLGVALQAAALLPSMRRCGVRLSPVWRPHDPGVRMIVSLSGWTFGFVAANQIAVFVVLVLEAHVEGGVSAYTYAYTFFQFPFAVVATSIVNVATPDLARAHSDADLAEVGRRFGRAARQVLALILPAAAGYIVLAQPAVTLLVRHGAEGPSATHLTAAVLALFTLGLPGYCLYFLAIRTFQAMRDTRTAFYCYLLENGTNLVFAFALFSPLGVRGLALSYSIAYTIAALVAISVLRRRLGTIGGRKTLSAALRSLALAAVMAVAVAAVSVALGGGGGLRGWLSLAGAVLAGGAVYLGGAGLAASLHSSKATSTRRR